MRDDVEPTEVAALLSTLVDEQMPGDDDLAEYRYLSARLALLKAAAEEVSARRDALVWRMNQEGLSHRRLAELFGDRTYASVQQMVNAAKERAVGA